MVLSLAVSVHLVQGWLDAPRSADRVARLRAIVRRLVFPCFFCTLTTTLGFASLATNDMPAVRYFGLFAALGVVVAFAAGMTLVPIGLSFLDPPASPLATPQHRGMQHLLDWASRVSVERPWWVLTIFFAITAVAMAGLPLVRNNTDLVRFLRSDAPLHRDTLYIDSHLTGTNTLEFVVTRRDGASLASHDAVARMAAFEQSALRHPEVTSVGSLLGVLRQLQRAESGSDALVLPPDERATAYAIDLLQAAPEQALIRKLVAPDFHAARFNVRIRAVGTSVAAPLAESILAEGSALLGDGYRVEAAGAFYQVARDSNHLVASQVKSFGSALVLVFVAIAVLFRSLRLTAISFVPNVMPIAWTARPDGLPRHRPLDRHGDDRVVGDRARGGRHDPLPRPLPARLRGRRPGRDPQTTRDVGPPLFVNNVVLVLGFWIGCFGSFKPTIYFSLLSGITMITALALRSVRDAGLAGGARSGAPPEAGVSRAICIAWLLVACLDVALADGRAGRARATRAALRRQSRRARAPDLRAVAGTRRSARCGCCAAATTTWCRPCSTPRCFRASSRRSARRRWPPGRTARATRMRGATSEALEAVRRTIWDRMPRDAPAADRRQKLWIEFVLGERAAAIAIGAFEMDDGIGDAGGGVHVRTREPLVVLEPSRAYMHRNMRLIAADSFHVEEAALGAVLGSLRLLQDPAEKEGM